jgi:hypothetical protein
MTWRAASDWPYVVVASRTAMLSRPGTLEIIHELLERLEAHLRAEGLFMVTANVRGSSGSEVATRLATNGGQLLRGLQVELMHTYCRHVIDSQLIPSFLELNIIP